MPKHATASLKVNDLAPDFDLPSHDGGRFKLSGLKGEKNVVIFFYPKDDSPGCTRQTCLFRDWHDDFTKHNAHLIGISSDSGSSHHDFAQKHNVPFMLLTDHGGAVRKRYGIKNDFGFIPGRATFVIDRNQVVRHIFVSQFNIDEHIEGALKALQSIDNEKA